MRVYTSRWTRGGLGAWTSAQNEYALRCAALHTVGRCAALHCTTAAAADPRYLRSSSNTVPNFSCLCTTISRASARFVLATRRASRSISNVSGLWSKNTSSPSKSFNVFERRYSTDLRYRLSAAHKQKCQYAIDGGWGFLPHSRLQATSVLPMARRPGG